MPVLDAVQTFAGITNENEFYSHHYLAEVFKGDIKARLDAWEAAETLAQGNEVDETARDRHRGPHRRLQAWAQKWFALRSQMQRAGDAAERWRLFLHSAAVGQHQRADAQKMREMRIVKRLNQRDIVQPTEQFVHDASHVGIEMDGKDDRHIRSRRGGRR